MPRNSTGNYTLPAGNPVQPNTIIETAWANPTMSDVASALSDSLDRQGRGTMLAPLKIMDGTVVAPSLAFNSNANTGMYLAAANTIGFAVGGVLGLSLGATGVTVAQGLHVSGTVALDGFLSIGGGNAATPGLSFTGDPNTGLYWVGADTLGWSTNGVGRMLLSVDGSLQFVAPTNAGAPVISMVVAAGGFGIDIRGRTGDQLGVLRLLSNDYTTQLFTVQCSNANAIVGTTQATPLLLQTANAARITISANGNVTLAAPTSGAHVFNAATVTQATTGGAFLNYQLNNGTNYCYIGGDSTSTYMGSSAAQTIRIQVNATDRYQVFDSGAHVWRNATAQLMTITNTGQFVLAASTSGLHTVNGAMQFTGTVGTSGDVVGNNFYINGGAAGAGTYGIASGLGGSVVTWGTTSPGAGAIGFYTQGGAKQVEIGAIGGAVNYWEMYGGVAGSRVALEARGTDANIGMWFINKGAGDHLFSANGGNTLQLLGNIPGVRWLQIAGASGSGNPSINATAGIVDFKSPWASTLAFRPPPSSVTFPCTYAFSQSFGHIGNGAANDRIHEWYYDLNAFSGLFLNDAGAAPVVWLSVVGGASTQVGSISLSALRAGTGGVFVNTNGSSSQGGFVVHDTGGAGANIRMEGDGATTPKKYIRVTGGSFQVLNDAYTLGLLTITDGGTFLDSRGLSLGRDPGATAGSTPPVGSLIIATVGAVSVAALATVVASTNNLTIQGTSAGANAVINAGTWRNCGARDAGVGHAFWLRIS